VSECNGDSELADFPIPERHTPTRVAAMAVDDIRLTTLEDAFAAHAKRKKERGAWGKVASSISRNGFGRLMPALLTRMS
jgi:hypothetical protein